MAWQVAADDPAVLAADMAELAAQLGARDIADARSPVALVHSALARYAVDWLLVFDSANDEASVRRFLPPAGRGRILITSQSAHWPGMRVLDVPVLTTEVAAGFLATRTGDLTAETARQLADELGGLPLALAQAVAYIQATCGSLAGYLELFLQRKAELLARGVVADHPASVAATVALALARLEASSPPALGLLRLLACLAAEPVPLALLETDKSAIGELDVNVAGVLRTLRDPVKAGDAVAGLRQYSLVNPAGKGMVLVHQLVQAITLGQMPTDTAVGWRGAAAALVEAAIPADTGLPGTWPSCAMLLPHVRAVLAEDSDGTVEMAIYLEESGSYAAARELWQKVADACERNCGAEHEHTLFARRGLANLTGRAGDPAAARDMLADLVPMAERVLGPEQPLTLATRGDLALWTGDAGDEAAARDMSAELVEAEERLFGPEDPNTIVSRFNHAAATGKSGNWARARDLLTALLPSVERALGVEDDTTLNTRAFLAAATGQAGDATGALRECVALMPVYERIFGLSHPRTLLLRSNIAYWTGAAGGAAEARDLYEALVPDGERVFGAEHPEVLRFRTDLGFWTGRAGDPAAARRQLDELSVAAERVLGTEHPDTLTARVYLARFIGETGEAEEARDLLASLVSVTSAVLGAEHPHTLNASAELARWTGEAGDPAAARDMFAALLPVREVRRGTQHPETVSDRKSP